MGYTISIGGKGGTGKTTVAGLVVRYLLARDMKPILVVDADPNTNLNDVLGVQIKTTLSDARERMKKDVPTGMTKDIFMQIQMEEALVEAEGFDLIAMGRPEGPGCYCAANSILSELLDKLMNHYPYLVIDNEAGMEHFSRLTQKDIDLLLLVSDPSKRGLTAACRIAEMVKDLPIRVGEQYLIVNQVRTAPSDWPDDVKKIFGGNIVTFPADPLITEYDLQGKPTFELPDDAPIVKASAAFLDEVFSQKQARLSSGVRT
ncbi:AAA family ATPase [Thermodesulforhabdus norvegica]|uniref:CO dehydrogenase maturation factor n=1 Tax=Thermodesulforhabdus norvegica TaxID=39841 RepID=A0A1I4UYX9_9BACT|nr:AAA family ATPase [Thermodesulforhabdus norvegica]SFM94075.1 CO dehydrogenase maturation factor [Thermodesulforhabdus norvegica]